MRFRSTTRTATIRGSPHTMASLCFLHRRQLLPESWVPTAGLHKDNNVTYLDCTNTCAPSLPHGTVLLGLWRAKQGGTQKAQGLLSSSQAKARDHCRALATLRPGARCELCLLPAGCEELGETLPDLVFFLLAAARLASSRHRGFPSRLGSAIPDIALDRSE